jgi:hypothetical protein
MRGLTSSSVPQHAQVCLSIVSSTRFGDGGAGLGNLRTDAYRFLF